MAEALTCPPPRGPSFRLWLLMLALAWCATGCATSNRDSDLPWNMQQPWETAPSIPGFTPP
jgi:hypothetical protein